jgi:hypothetical protein
MGDTGLEHTTNSLGNLHGGSQSGAESGAVLPSATASLSPELWEIVEAWTKLPPAVTAGIVAMVRASKA